MKTMLELVVRLAELKKCEQRLSEEGQITERERAAAECLQDLIRESLPAEVLPHFDRLLETEAPLLNCPEVFAMAVIVAAYREGSPSSRKKLLTFYELPKKGKLERGHIAAKGHSAFPRDDGRALAA